VEQSHAGLLHYPPPLILCFRVLRVVFEPCRSLLWPYASSLCPPHHCWILSIVDRSYTSSYVPSHWKFQASSPTCCGCVCIAVVGFESLSLCVCLPSSLSPTHRRWTLRIIVGSYVSSTCPMRRRWALRVVVVSYAPSLDPTSRLWVLHLVVRVLHVVSSGTARAMGSSLSPTCRWCSSSVQPIV